MAVKDRPENILLLRKKEKKEKVKEIAKRNNIESGYAYSRGGGAEEERNQNN